MNKGLYKNFGKALQSFFEDYLLKECGASRHTIKSYSETFCLFVEFADKIKNTRPDNIQLDNINKDYIREFLDWLERERNCKPQTRNHRNTVMRSFFKFMMYYDTIHLSQWQEILSIKPKRVQQEVIKYLSVDGINALIDHISADTKVGQRNLAMISLLYYSGLRVQELIDLTPRSIRNENPHVVEVKGKRNKKRLVCINENMYKLLNSYMENYSLNTESKLDRPLFFNRSGAKLTDAGVTHILQKYAKLAHEDIPTLVPVNITPHWLRHSRAEHLLQGGAELIEIRDFLGHASVTTTEIYARVNIEMKHKALLTINEEIGIKEPKVKSWERNPELKSLLKILQNN